MPDVPKPDAEDQSKRLDDDDVEGLAGGTVTEIPKEIDATRPDGSRT